MVRKMLFVLSILLISVGAFAKEPSRVFGLMKVNKKTVTVGEPVIITIEMYTNTWFTKGVTLSELKVPNSITMPIADRYAADRKVIGGEQFSVLRQRFICYPLEAGKVDIQEIEVPYFSPDKGDYKAVERFTKVRGSSFTSKSLAPNIQLSASRLKVKQSWSAKVDTVLQGDVLDRTIKIQAKGTVAALITPTVYNDIEGVGVYVKKAKLKNVTSEEYNTAYRTEKVSFLFKEAGEFGLPDFYLKYYNYARRRNDSILVKGKKWYVKENPNLDFVLSMQDSLANLNKQLDVEEEEQKPWTFYGYSKKEVFWYSILGIVSLILLINILRRLRTISLDKKAKFKKSEESSYQDFKKACSTKNYSDIITKYYVWQMRYDREYILNKDDKSALISLIENDFKEEQSKAKAKDLLNLVNKIRKNRVKTQNKTVDYRINPE